MPFAIHENGGNHLLVAYETCSDDVPEPQPTIYARLVAGWECPECGEVLHAYAGPWNDRSAAWWSYDHRDVVHRSEKTDVRPGRPRDMPNYRGLFDETGGYLRSFSHRQPLQASSYANHVTCDLHVSHRLGLASGIGSLPGIPHDCQDRLVTALSTGASLKHVRLIPDVVGQREPIVAMTRESYDQWHTRTLYKYGSHDYDDVWPQFTETLLKPV